MLEEMFAEVESELIYHIIPFWKKMKDDERGGFYGLLDFELNLHKDAEKAAFLTAAFFGSFLTRINWWKIKNL